VEDAISPSTPSTENFSEPGVGFGIFVEVEYEFLAWVG
jgi:hypothetical protein